MSARLFVALKVTTDIRTPTNGGWLMYDDGGSFVGFLPSTVARSTLAESFAATRKRAACIQWGDTVEISLRQWALLQRAPFT